VALDAISRQLREEGIMAPRNVDPDTPKNHGRQKQDNIITDYGRDNSMVVGPRKYERRPDKVEGDNMSIAHSISGTSVKDRGGDSGSGFA
jgi:hypothetical protein